MCAVLCHARFALQAEHCWIFQCLQSSTRYIWVVPLRQKNPKKRLKKAYLLSRDNAITDVNVLNYKSVCERVCIWVHIWASLAVSENGQGLFLSGPIRGCCLFSSLIALPRANIPFVFPPFPLLFVFFIVAVGLEKGFAFVSVSCPSSFLLYFISYFSVAHWLAVDRPYGHTHIPRHYSHQTCHPVWLFFPSIQVFIDGQCDQWQYVNPKSELIWSDSDSSGILSGLHPNLVS